MHREILTEEQVYLLPLIKSFSKHFGLVGGTAIALYIGHRRSIDFDLFSNREFDNGKIRRNIVRHKKIERVIKDERGEYTIVIDGVRVTFFLYPFAIRFPKNFNHITRLPNLITLAAMKAHALGRRAKWKDYVDLYFIMKNYHSLNEIIQKARRMFSVEFNEKLFRAQLSYFEDIDYSEKIIYRNEFSVDDKTVKKELMKISLM